MGGHHKKDADAQPSNKNKNHHAKENHAPAKKGHGGRNHEEQPAKLSNNKKGHGGRTHEVQAKANPNLTKRDLKMLEKLHAKIEYLEIRDEYDEADKLREQMTAIEDNANAKAMKKAERRSG
ncbi:expressed unknown protein [Seminavis robusta]|uniref:UVR domain-containing protein n=1 Tax=Seminavis robusta TaxID=568900 RepID=A0A9N8DYL1_9STRA|nr:expressed unknown protein [Seminavis robusta]|eukprot:Sro478_g151090.1 n/a (122) ;mRNA; f:61968-62449